MVNISVHICLFFCFDMILWDSILRIEFILLRERVRAFSDSCAALVFILWDVYSNQEIYNYFAKVKMPLAANYLTCVLDDEHQICNYGLLCIHLLIVLILSFYRVWASSLNVPRRHPSVRQLWSLESGICIFRMIDPPLKSLHRQF